MYKFTIVINLVCNKLHERFKCEILKFPGQYKFQLLLIICPVKYACDCETSMPSALCFKLSSKTHQLYY